MTRGRFYRFRLRASTPTAAPLMPASYDDRRHAADDRPDPADRPRLSSIAVAGLTSAEALETTRKRTSAVK